MDFILGIIVTLLLTAVGYIYLLKYNFNGSEIKLSKDAFLAWDFKRVAYIAVSILAGTGICLIYRLLYSGASTITQLKLIIMVMLLIPIAVADFKQHIIPNIILIVGLVLRIIIYIFEFVQNGSNILEVLKYDLIGAVVIVLFFMLCMLVMRNSIGMGDVKLFGLMGLYHGLWGVMSSVFFSLLVAFVLSVILLLTKKKGRKDNIPFGPSILIGTYIAVILTGI